MLNTLRKAVVAHKMNEIKQEFQRAGESIQQLLLTDALDRLGGETAWPLIHGLEASLTVMEGTLRGLLRTPETLDPAVTRSLRDLQAAVVTLRSTLSGMTPLIEAQFGLPPKGTVWTVEPPG